MAIDKQMFSCFHIRF